MFHRPENASPIAPSSVPSVCIPLSASDWPGCRVMNPQVPKRRVIVDMLTVTSWQHQVLTWNSNLHPKCADYWFDFSKLTSDECFPQVIDRWFFLPSCPSGALEITKNCSLTTSPAMKMAMKIQLNPLPLCPKSIKSI